MKATAWSAAKLARHIKERLHKKPLLVSADVYRTAAREQLQRLAAQAGLAYFQPGSEDPVAIAQAALSEAKARLYDVLILDTAGRQHVDTQMMDEVRKTPGSKGMVTANGNYVTKQSAGIYSAQPPNKPFAPKDPALYQREIDRDKGPPVAEAANGRATVETYTVMHDRKGPSYAILFGRLGDGRRFIANTPEDPGLLCEMVERDMIGAGGQVTHRDRRNLFLPA